MSKAETKKIFDRATQRWNDQHYFGPGYKYRDEILFEEVSSKLAELLSPRPTLASGLRRDLKTVEYFRDAILKLEIQANLTDAELKHLIIFYGILVIAGDILDQRYILFTENFIKIYRRLLELAAERGWSKSLIDMYGVGIRDLFQRIVER